MPDKMIPLCRIYENVSKTTGKRYFVGNLSFTSKLLILENKEAQEGEPQWTVFLTEREQKPRDGESSRLTTKPKPYPQAGDHGGIDGGDWPIRRPGHPRH